MIASIPNEILNIFFISLASPLIIFKFLFFLTSFKDFDPNLNKSYTIT